MKKMAIVFPLILLLLLIGISCQKITPVVPPAGQLEKIVLEDLSAIPVSYGTLTAVTAHAQYEGWSQLWFVDEMQTIRMVRVQFHFNRIHENVLVIPRK